MKHSSTIAATNQPSISAEKAFKYWNLASARILFIPGRGRIL
jgi:hypothetical protein